LLLTHASAWQDFKVLKQTTKDNLATLKLEPKDPTKYADMTSVNVTLNLKENEIRSLSYMDEIDNEVIYEFAKTDTAKKISKSKFAYQPPKGAEVVVY
jgi:outer membrane lipoprotein-sorting protein